MHQAIQLLATLATVLVGHSAASEPANPRGLGIAPVPAETQKCEAEKVLIRQLAKEHADANVNAVNKHNKLAAEYNVLLRSHSDLIKQFNKLVSELEDPSWDTFLSAKAIKVYHHPGIEGAVNKTSIHVLPVAQETLLLGQLKGAQWFNETQSKVHKFLLSNGGEVVEDWLPAMSGLVVYGSVLIPISIACWCVIEFVCKFQQLLLFGHVYLAVVGASLGAFASTTGTDPLRTFAQQDPKLYMFAQCAFGVVLMAYGILSASALCCSDKDPGFRCVQLFVTMAACVCYYLLVWTPAMVDETPQVEKIVEALSKATGRPPNQMVVAPYVLFCAMFTLLFFGEGSASTRKVDDAEAEQKSE